MGNRHQFPGFDAIYELTDPELTDPVLHDAYRGSMGVQVPFSMLSALMRGQMQPDETVIVRHAMGGRRPGNVVWTTARALIVSQVVVDLLAAHGFTGWATCPVEVRDARRWGDLRSITDGAAPRGRQILVVCLGDRIR